MSRLFETIVIVLLMLWFVGFVSGTAGSHIHMLLLMAAVALVLRIIKRKQANSPFTDYKPTKTTNL